jgi:hypothetical protein
VRKAARNSRAAAYRTTTTTPQHKVASGSDFTGRQQHSRYASNRKAEHDAQVDAVTAREAHAAYRHEERVRSHHHRGHRYWIAKIETRSRSKLQWAEAVGDQRCPAVAVTKTMQDLPGYCWAVIYCNRKASRLKSLPQTARGLRSLRQPA